MSEQNKSLAFLGGLLPVRVTADIYSHAIHGQDDEAARLWEEYRQRNRPPQPAKSVQ